MHSMSDSMKFLSRVIAVTARDSVAPSILCCGTSTTLAKGKKSLLASG